MTVPIKTVLQNVKSYLLATGFFSEVSIGEPKAPPSSFAAAVFMATGEAARLTHSSMTEGDTVTVRLYRSVMEEPAEDVEIAMAELVSTIRVAALGAFDLTSSVASLEVERISVRWDWMDVSGVAYRVADIDLPLVYRQAAS